MRVGLLKNPTEVTVLKKGKIPPSNEWNIKLLKDNHY